MKDRIDTYLKKDKRTIYLVIIALVIIAFGAVPFYMDVDTSFTVYYLFICFIYIVLSQGWNLVAGYTGQISLGSHAFFALGAYTTAIIWVNDVTRTWYYFDPLVMILSGIVPAIFAIIIGIPLLSRLRGDYFSLILPKEPGVYVFRALSSNPWSPITGSACCWPFWRRQVYIM
jgi:ABC-type branched-subunit amino acid transport system permease subunit